MQYLQVTKVKKYVHGKEKRINKLALECIDRKVEAYLDALCSQHNGGTKTLDETVVNYISIK